MKAYWLFVPLLLVPCGAAAQEPPQGSAPPAERPCAVTLAGADLSGWKEVRATGFTFCVPAEWRPSGRARNGTDARTWRAGSGSVTWGTGTPGRKLLTTTETTVVITQGPASSMPPAPISPAPRRQVRNFAENIGGEMADLWDNEFDGAHHTGAKWNSPRAVYVTGESRDSRSAAVQLQVYRTVRFVQP